MAGAAAEVLLVIVPTFSKGGVLTAGPTIFQWFLRVLLANIWLSRESLFCASCSSTHYPTLEPVYEAKYFRVSTMISVRVSIRKVSAKLWTLSDEVCFFSHISRVYGPPIRDTRLILVWQRKEDLDLAKTVFAGLYANIVQQELRLIGPNAEDFVKDTKRLVVVGTEEEDLNDIHSLTTCVVLVGSDLEVSNCAYFVIWAKNGMNFYGFLFCFMQERSPVKIPLEISSKLSSSC